MDACRTRSKVKVYQRKSRNVMDEIRASRRITPARRLCVDRQFLSCSPRVVSVAYQSSKSRTRDKGSHIV